MESRASSASPESSMRRGLVNGPAPPSPPSTAMSSESTPTSDNDDRQHRLDEFQGLVALLRNRDQVVRIRSHTLDELEEGPRRTFLKNLKEVTKHFSKRAPPAPAPPPATLPSPPGSTARSSEEASVPSVEGSDTDFVSSSGLENAAGSSLGLESTFAAGDKRKRATGDDDGLSPPPKRDYDPWTALYNKQRFEVPDCILTRIGNTDVSTLGDAQLYQVTWGVLSDPGREKAVLVDKTMILSFLSPVQDDDDMVAAIRGHVSYTSHVEKCGELEHIRWLFSLLGWTDFVRAQLGTTGRRLGKHNKAELIEILRDLGYDPQHLEEDVQNIHRWSSIGVKLVSLCGAYDESALFVLADVLTKNFVTNRFWQGDYWKKAAAWLDAKGFKDFLDAQGLEPLARKMRSEFSDKLLTYIRASNGREDMSECSEAEVESTSGSP